MGGSSAPSNTTSKTTTELPEWAQPYSQQLLQKGVDLSNQSMPVYTGQRSADLNSFQRDGLNMAAGRAYSGSPDITAGSNQLQSTLNGNYLGYNAGTNQYAGDNPYLSQAIDAASQDATRNFNSAVNGTDATFARAGAFGGSAWQQAQQGNSHELANSLANTATNARMQNYNQSASLAENALNRNQSAYLAERGNQLAALSPGLAYGNQAYTDAQQLQNSGNTVYADAQQHLTDQMNQWNEQAQSPYKQLDVLGNTIRAAVGGGSSVSQSAPGTNPYAQAAGGAAALYSLFG
jgi:hypothetical protein